LAIVTSQALKYDFLTFVSMFKQFYSKFDKPSTTFIYTTSYLIYHTLHWLQWVEHINVTSCWSYTKTIYCNNGPNTNCVT